MANQLLATIDSDRKVWAEYIPDYQLINQEFLERGPPELTTTTYNDDGLILTMKFENGIAKYKLYNLHGYDDPCYEANLISWKQLY